MSTPATAIAGGFFAQLMPMLADRTVMMIVSKADEQHLTISVIPKRTKDSENAALLTPFCCTGTPEELDRELPTQVREFVAGHVALGTNLAEIQREREEAEKAAREELKKKQKTVQLHNARINDTLNDISTMHEDLQYFVIQDHVRLTEFESELINNQLDSVHYIMQDIYQTIAKRFKDLLIQEEEHSDKEKMNKSLQTATIVVSIA